MFFFLFFSIPECYMIAKSFIIPIHYLPSSGFSAWLLL